MSALEVKLNQAIQVGDVFIIHEIVQKRPNLFYSNVDMGHRLLRVAIFLKQHRIVECLIGYGVNVNYKNPLKVAVEAGSLKCIESLLRNGADLSGSPWDGLESPAAIALGKYGRPQREEILKLLLKHDMDTCFRKQVIPRLFHWLARMASFKDEEIEDIADILFKAGVPVDEYDDHGYTPLQYAIESWYEGTGNFALIWFLLEHAGDFKKKLKNIEKFPLHPAVANCFFELIEYIIWCGGDVEAKDDKGRTPLHVACIHNCPKMIRCLIRNGASISPKDNNGRTPYSLLRNGRPMILEFAKLSFQYISICESDANLLQSRDLDLQYFEGCMGELHRIASTIFFRSHSYYSVLKISKKKLAVLVEDEEFVKNFYKNFPVCSYKRELMDNVEEAIKIREKNMSVYSRLSSIFDRYLPGLVIKRVTEYMDFDLPL